MIDYGQETLFGKKTISTVNYDEQEILRDLLYLHCDSKPIDVDVTYSSGNFYKKGLPVPKLKFDLHPQTHDTVEADCRNLPLEDNSIGILMFDPPFICGIPAEAKAGIIKERFGYFKNTFELWKFYDEAMKEFYRILKPKGTLIFKCQDTVDSSKNYFSHCHIYDEAQKLGFYCKDLFVLVAKNRIIDIPPDEQQHARKFHSFFWVLIKK